MRPAAKGHLARRRKLRRVDAVNEAIEMDPFLREWLSLTPAERLRRSWAMRSRIKDLETAHDEKSLPKL